MPMNIRTLGCERKQSRNKADLKKKIIIRLVSFDI